MKRNIVTLTILALAFAFVAASAQTKKGHDPLDEARQAIIKSNAIYFESFVKNDPQIFIDRYAKDCCIMMPNAPALCGENAARDFFKMAYEQFHLRNGKFIITQIYGDGKEYVTEEGVWHSIDANNVVYDHGKYLVLWKKTPEGWKMFRDSFSSDLAPQN